PSPAAFPAAGSQGRKLRPTGSPWIRARKCSWTISFELQQGPRLGAQTERWGEPGLPVLKDRFLVACDEALRTHRFDFDGSPNSELVQENGHGLPPLICNKAAASASQRPSSTRGYSNFFNALSALSYQRRASSFSPSRQWAMAKNNQS